MVWRMGPRGTAFAAGSSCRLVHDRGSANPFSVGCLVEGKGLFRNSVIVTYACGAQAHLVFHAHPVRKSARRLATVGDRLDRSTRLLPRDWAACVRRPKSRACSLRGLVFPLTATTCREWGPELASLEARPQKASWQPSQLSDVEIHRQTLVLVTTGPS